VVVRTSTVKVLGPLEVWRGGEQARVEGLKRRQALAVLVAAGGGAVPETRLWEALWGEAPPESAQASLQSHISRLRQAIRPLEIVTVAGGYALDISSVDLDADRFEALAGEGRALGAEAAADRLEEALSLWRGPAFGDLAGLPGVRGEALRLEELRLVVTEERIDLRLAAGAPAEVVADLEALVVDHPLRERFWRQLMLALHRSGRQGEALRRFEALRVLLRDELGLEPSPVARELADHILADDDVAPAPSARPAPAAPSPPPRELTSLIGRDLDVDEVRRALGTASLVTISGPGGVGKTRVALRVASLLEGQLRDGAVVVELAPLRDPGRLVDVVARALDVQQRQHRSMLDSVTDFLAGRELVLVLDNCEHLADAVASLVDSVRQACPTVSVLATSRAPLGLPAERVHVLAPLPAPGAGAQVEEVARSPAVQLFVERAAAARPGFSLDEGNVAPVAEVCRRLDGLPLALELAAARLRSLGPAALASRLDQRFALLAGDRRGVDERHHTLRRVVEWSYDLLEPLERAAFSQLAVFAGSFGLQAAEHVCRPEDPGSSAIGALLDLVEKSMVRVVDPDEPRYVVLETLRQFGQEQLGAEDIQRQVEARHRDWYLGFAEDAASGLDSPEEGAWADRVDRELDNLRAAHASAVREGDVDPAVQMVSALREYSFRRIRYEIAGWAEATTAMEGYREHPNAYVVAAVDAYGRWVRGDLESAISLAREAVGLQGTSPAASCGLPERVLANAHFYLGNTDEALTWVDRMLRSGRGSASSAQLAHALYMASVASISVGEHGRGVELAEEASEVAARAGSPTAAAQAAYALGLAARSVDGARAEAELRRAAHLAERAGNRWIRAFALTEVHWLEARRGELLAGLAGFSDVIDAWHRGGDWANLWLSLRHVFAILVELRSHEAAGVLYGALAATGAARALPLEPADAERLDREVGALRRAVRPADLAETEATGGGMSESEVVTFVQAAIASTCR
jgi:predicted ATPase/DNA-binding SARP family transcriptional activator